MRLALASLTTGCLIALLPATGADAQSLGRALARTGLVQEDVNIMVQTAATLYASGDAAVGRDVIWTNPKTQAFGMAEITEVQGDCVRVAYRFQTRRKPATETIVTRRCRVGGKWVLSD